MKKILLDQLHVDIYQTADLTPNERGQVTRVINRHKTGLAILLEALFGLKLQGKIKVEVTE
jgi:hypothetical protein